MNDQLQHEDYSSEELASSVDDFNTTEIIGSLPQSLLPTPPSQYIDDSASFLQPSEMLLFQSFDVESALQTSTGETLPSYTSLTASAPPFPLNTITTTIPTLADEISHQVRVQKNGEHDQSNIVDTGLIHGYLQLIVHECKCMFAHFEQARKHRAVAVFRQLVEAQQFGFDSTGRYYSLPEVPNEISLEVSLVSESHAVTLHKDQPIHSSKRPAGETAAMTEGDNNSRRVYQLVITLDSKPTSTTASSSSDNGDDVQMGQTSTPSLPQQYEEQQRHVHQPSPQQEETLRKRILEIDIQGYAPCPESSHQHSIAELDALSSTRDISMQARQEIRWFNEHFARVKYYQQALLQIYYGV
ncbi:hypothetical protein BDB00DRAFT_868095 [Zychaea mexicana]|uniref:uncharacterized protein n=1 Tax=Zychaea mexicana TaxID=64656 RepID=UPI0022FDDAB1|nr:uncharacterized protein BDB00DRAFT_868095 [Zychaea mexicana]KAI9497960.1 hypothetical protein BDB00DRAFT_868095 [Zychaea mexicana]